MRNPFRPSGKPDNVDLARLQREVDSAFEDVTRELNKTASNVVQPPSFSDATRPDAAKFTAGYMIWNTTDDAPNFSDGSIWVDAVGVAT